MDKPEAIRSSASGEIEELKYGQVMEVTGPEGVQVKIVITSQGITAIALADQEEAAHSVLQRLGFPADRIESRCVGPCCLE